jgi:hypothetical protein
MADEWMNLPPATVAAAQQAAREAGAELSEQGAHHVARAVVAAERVRLVSLLRLALDAALKRLARPEGAAESVAPQPGARAPGAPDREAPVRHYELAPETPDLAALVRQRLGDAIPEEPAPAEGAPPDRRADAREPLFDRRNANRRREDAGGDSEDRPIFGRRRGR